jgi:hypothetical protein
VHQDRPHHGLDLSTLEGAVLIPKSNCQNNTARDETCRLAARRSIGRWLLTAEIIMERVFIGVSRAEATRKADEWWGRQHGLRQTLRNEVAFGGKGPDGQLDRWAITIRLEDENSRMMEGVGRSDPALPARPAARAYSVLCAVPPKSAQSRHGNARSLLDHALPPRRRRQRHRGHDRR